MRFYIDNNRIKINPKSLLLKGLMSVWEADKSSDKKRAISLLTYIHLISRIDSEAPFSNLSYKDVREKASKLIWDGNNDFLGFSEIDVEDIVKEYQLAYEKPEEAVVRAYNEKIHEVREVLEAQEIVLKENKGKYVSNFAILHKMMKELVTLINCRDELKKIIRRDASDEFGSTGKKLSILERKRRVVKKKSSSVSDNVEIDGDLVEELDKTVTDI